MKRKHLDKETEFLERQLLSEKPWYLKGEVAARGRGDNTVLEEHLEVNRALAEAQEDPLKEGIRRDITELIANLDALSNLHFTPRLVRFELFFSKSGTTINISKRIVSVVHNSLFDDLSQEAVPQ
ncbi:unnamed protein product [Protopolystoma xenopodis]|uniref:Uncharacterized protein n=1 Tax=Protopolystoma xenopodis TaxID=117903 RepID=A0A448XNJ0_9PLAT|nr:unnamed protein product [Protopolystoma xenopodis]